MIKRIFIIVSQTDGRHRKCERGFTRVFRFYRRHRPLLVALGGRHTLRFERTNEPTNRAHTKIQTHKHVQRLWVFLIYMNGIPSDDS